MKKKTSIFSRLRPETKICALLVILTLAAFSRSLVNGFTNYDDDKYVTANFFAQSGLNVSSIVWAFTTTHASNWHPVTWLSHMLDAQIYGINPLGHHLTSLLLHALSVALLFLLLNKMTGSVWRSAFVAALFAVHPLRVESVAWVAERKDVLSALFWILTIWAYVRYADRPGAKRYLAVALIFALGLMAKPMLVTLPFVLLLLDYWPLRRLSTLSHFRLVLEKIPLFALAAGSGVMTMIAQQRGGAVSALDQTSLGFRVGNALISYVAYIGKTLWPSGLSVIYPIPPGPIPLWKVIVAAFLVILATILAVKARRKSPFVAFGWLYYLITLIPVIGLVQVGSQAMADRYTYIPSIGLFVLVACGIPTLIARLERFNQPDRAIAVVSVAVVLALSVVTFVQTGHWSDGVTLFSHATDVTEDNYVAYNHLGAAFAAQGDISTAIPNYKEALRIQPSSAEAHINLAATLVAQGDLAGALAELRTALQIKPRQFEGHANIASVLAMMGRVNEAIPHFQEALRARPMDAGVRLNYAMALFQAGDLSGAWREVHLGVNYGGVPNPNFLRDLSSRMPDPGQ